MKKQFKLINNYYNLKIYKISFILSKLLIFIFGIKLKI